jgi:ankyrin repeat protein
MDVFQIVRLNEEDIFFQNIDKFDINIINKSKNNLLQEAIAANSLKIGKALIEKKINVNFQDKNGQTSLHYAAAYSNYNLAVLILENGGDLSVKDKYGNNSVWTAIFNAKGEYYDIVSLFLKNGGDVLNKNNNNKSPLDFALQINDTALLDLIKTYNPQLK